jgi:hypothetical protein
MNKSRAALQRLKQQEQSKKGASQGSAIDLCSSPDENRAPVVVDVDSGEEKEREAGKETAAEKRERRARRDKEADQERLFAAHFAKAKEIERGMSVGKDLEALNEFLAAIECATVKKADKMVAHERAAALSNKLGWLNG